MHGLKDFLNMENARQACRYKITHLQVQLEAIFFEMVLTNIKVFILWPRDLRNECFVSICVEVICFQHQQHESCVRTAKRSSGCNHDDSLEDNYCVPFFKLKFLIPTLRHIFYSPNSSNIHGECDFARPVSGNKSGKYTFLWFFKRHITNGRKNKSEFYQKIC